MSKQNRNSRHSYLGPVAVFDRTQFHDWHVVVGLFFFFWVAGLFVCHYFKKRTLEEEK